MGSVTQAVANREEEAALWEKIFSRALGNGTSNERLQELYAEYRDWIKQTGYTPTNSIIGPTNNSNTLGVFGAGLGSILPNTTFYPDQTVTITGAPLMPLESALTTARQKSPSFETIKVMNGYIVSVQYPNINGKLGAAPEIWLASTLEEIPQVFAAVMAKNVMQE